MKHLIKALTSVALLAITSLASAQDFELQCHTAPLTTSLSIVSKNGEATVNMFHFNGIQYMPIHEGLVTIADIDYLQEQAKVMKQMPTEMVFKTTSDQCEWFSGFKGKCFSRDDQKLGTLNTDGFHLMIMEEETRILDYSPFRSILTRMSLRIDGKQYTIPMEFSEIDCELKN